MFSHVCYESTLRKCVFVDFAATRVQFLCHTPSTQHGFVQSPERTKERASPGP